MIHFAQAQYLLLLLLIPFFFIIQTVVLKMRRRRIRKFGDEALVEALMPSYAKARVWVRLTLFSIGFLFFVVGLDALGIIVDEFGLVGKISVGIIVAAPNLTA